MLSLLLTLLAMSTASAAPPSHAGLRVEVKPELRLSERLRLDVVPTFRTDPGNAEWFTTTVLNVNIGGTWRVSPGYRIGAVVDDGEWGLAHRAQVDVSWRHSTDWLGLELRQRYQAGLPGARPGVRHMTRSRALFGASLPGTPLRPGLGVETFFELGQTPSNGSGLGVQRVRIDTSLAWPIGAFTPSLTYRYEEPIRDRQRARMHRVFFLLGIALDARRKQDQAEPLP